MEFYRIPHGVRRRECRINSLEGRGWMAGGEGVGEQELWRERVVINPLNYFYFNAVSGPGHYNYNENAACGPRHTLIHRDRSHKRWFIRHLSLRRSTSHCRQADHQLIGPNCPSKQQRHPVL
jgi:hypothetical protein